jgi:hypothetical protein
MVEELVRPVVPGMYGYLVVSSCLSAVGIGVAYSIEQLVRKYIKTIYLKSDGRTLLINFHSAYTVNSKQNRDTLVTFDISQFKASEESSAGNFRLDYGENKTMEINLSRNEEKYPIALEVMNEVVKGSYINTFKRALKKQGR